MDSEASDRLAWLEGECEVLETTLAAMSSSCEQVGVYMPADVVEQVAERVGMGCLGQAGKRLVDAEAELRRVGGEHSVWEEEKAGLEERLAVALSQLEGDRAQGTLPSSSEVRHAL